MQDIPFFAVFLAMIGGAVALMYAVAALVDLGIYIRRKIKQR